MVWTAVSLLQAWEAAGGLTPPARSAMLLCADHRVASTDAALDLDVAAAARLLSASLIESFGARVDLVATCPSCAGTLQADAEIPLIAPGPASTVVDGWQVRLPTLRELADVYDEPDAAAQLRAACLSPASGTDDAQSGTSRRRPAVAPSAAVVDAAVAELSGAAVFDGEVTCPDCATSFVATLDVSSLLWDQVRTRAPRILADVALLARHYGWTEPDVLALSEARRAAYLALAGSA